MLSKVRAKRRKTSKFRDKTIAATGRPAGWCDLIARWWPVDAVVGENGAFFTRK